MALIDCSLHLGVFDGVAQELAELILQLQVADLNDIKNRALGKQREGVQNDGDIAVSIMEENTRTMQQYLLDRRMAQSITDAVCSDGELITTSLQQERAAREDHAYAHQLNGSSFDANASPSPKAIDDEILSRLAALYVSEPLGQQIAKETTLHGPEEDEINPENSLWAARRETSHDASMRACVACQEEKPFFDRVPVPCDHEYCRDCLQDLFRSSFTDESLFPPRCCRQDIPANAVSIFLTSELRQRFEEKKVEFSTPDRTYCSESSCSSFISPYAMENEVATCQRCSERTCTMCKMAAHIGQDCPMDTAMQAVDALARENGWQRCYSCRRMVELEIGCNHMT